MATTPPEKVPEPGTPWREVEPYALAFDGYEFAGGRGPLEALSTAARREYKATRAVPGTIQTLRAVLFYEQRLFHDARSEPDRGFVDAILTAIGKAT
jgi:hypothetical protein